MSRTFAGFRRDAWKWLRRGGVAAAIAVLIPVAAMAQTPSEVVKWHASLPAPGLVKRGGKVTAKLKAKIEPGWHVYSISQPPGGPTPTVISVPKGQRLRQVGPVTGPMPHSVYDPNFQMRTEFYRDSALFKIPLRATPKAALGAGKATIGVLFQACNDRICLPPSTVHVSLDFRIARPGHR